MAELSLTTAESIAGSTGTRRAPTDATPTELTNSAPVSLGAHQPEGTCTAHCLRTRRWIVTSGPTITGRAGRNPVAVSNFVRCLESHLAYAELLGASVNSGAW